MKTHYNEVLVLLAQVWNKRIVVLPPLSFYILFLFFTFLLFEAFVALLYFSLIGLFWTLFDWPLWTLFNMLTGRGNTLFYKMIITLFWCTQISKTNTGCMVDMQDRA